MGKVYLAVHPDIGRQAAVKVLAATDAADPQLASRFITEARAANAIRHPNIVDIYDSGVLPDGTPYIVMEYLEGETLQQVLLRGQLPIADAFDWGCQIAEALSAAHLRDVVHRDLKPDNLFLLPDPRRLGKRQVKVLDFGIAKLQRTTLGQVHKTRTGSLLGTPLYMSPEQCVGGKNVDHRTDIYSLGVILYEAVAGKRPFDSDGVYELINMHVNQPATPPSQHRPDLPGSFEAVILQALAKEPAERQPSMAVLLSQLELARGNPAASSEALARAQRETLRAIPLPDTHQIPEIRTLGDAAVSRSASAPTVRGRLPPKIALALGSLLILSVGGFYALGPFGRKPAPVKQAVVTPVIPKAHVVEPPAEPSRVDMGLDSVPPGAEVFVGDALLGKTPTRYRSAPTTAPVEFVFRLPGYEAERIVALPAPGLTVSARFSTPTPVPTQSKRSVPDRHKRASKPHELPSDDIQTER
jgi:eukaryotic-like serine/threonine-protein kinase